MVDKYAVKEYVAGIIGEECVIPTLGIWDKVEDIEWEKLPSQFVLKTTHGGGSLGVVICKDKATFNRHEAVKLLRRNMKGSDWSIQLEWPYKNVPHRIIAETYIEPSSAVKDLVDYKWYCFNGEPKFCQVIQGRTSKENIDFFDIEWKHQVFVGLNPYAKNSKTIPQRPQKLHRQIDIARALSKSIPFSRIDLYETANQVLFGEITFYPLSGLGLFRPLDYDLRLGELIDLSKIASNI